MSHGIVALSTGKEGNILISYAGLPQDSVLYFTYRGLDKDKPITEAVKDTSYPRWFEYWLLEHWGEQRPGEPTRLTYGMIITLDTRGFVAGYHFDVFSDLFVPIDCDLAVFRGKEAVIEMADPDEVILMNPRDYNRTRIYTEDFEERYVFTGNAHLDSYGNSIF